MTQATDWSVPLSGPASPDVMADRMDKSLDALLSSHSGASRPAYAVAGTIWISTATAGKLKTYLFDGVSDRLLQTVDTTTGAITYEGGTIAGPVNYANQALSNPAGKWLKGYISPGFNLANNATDATNDINFPAGQVASDEATPILMDHAAGTAQLDVVYGTGNGGRFSSAAISDGTWHCFVISNGTTVSRGFSKNLNPTSDNSYPSGYTHYRRVGSILRISGAIKAFTQFGDYFKFKTAIADRNSTAASAEALLALSVPSGIVVQPICTVTLGIGASSAGSIGFGDAASGSVISLPFNIASTNAAGISCQVDVPPTYFTNTAAQIYFSFVINFGTITGNTLLTMGWIDTRGLL